MVESFGDSGEVLNASLTVDQVIAHIERYTKTTIRIASYISSYSDSDKPDWTVVIARKTEGEEVEVTKTGKVLSIALNDCFERFERMVHAGVPINQLVKGYLSGPKPDVYDEVTKSVSENDPF